MSRIRKKRSWRLASIGLVALLAMAPGSNWLTAAQRFSVEEEGGVYWLTDPSDKPFFSMGINVVNRGDDSSTTPGYSASSFYSSDMGWAVSTARRLHHWGFSTIGGWSDWELLRQVPGSQFAHTPVLHMGSIAGAPWLDMWSDQWFYSMKNAVGEGIMAADRQVIGHYSDNELDWWNGALFRETLAQPASSGQRQRLVALLQLQYDNDWNHLLKDFEPVGASSFGDLKKTGQVFLRPGSSGIRSYRDFLAVLSARYYKTTTEIVHRRSPGRLLLGDRYMAYYYPQLVRAAGREVDVVSTNLKASWNDGTFARFYLDSLHQLSGKPIMLVKSILPLWKIEVATVTQKAGFRR